MGLVNDINALNPTYNKWYMDDGIVGDVELLKNAWEIIKTRGAALGLHLNQFSCSTPCPIRRPSEARADQRDPDVRSATRERRVHRRL